MDWLWGFTVVRVLIVLGNRYNYVNACLPVTNQSHMEQFLMMPVNLFLYFRLLHLTPYHTEAAHSKKRQMAHGP